jgi:hypothetical protein
MIIYYKKPNIYRIQRCRQPTYASVYTSAKPYRVCLGLPGPDSYRDSSLLEIRPYRRKTRLETRHRIWVGPLSEALRTVRDRSVDLIVTWLLHSVGEDQEERPGYEKNFGLRSEWIKECYRVLKDGGILCIINLPTLTPCFAVSKRELSGNHVGRGRWRRVQIGSL